jgi:two-component system, cell cycle sensor histidine kinase and response regulator CckA
MLAWIVPPNPRTLHDTPLVAHRFRRPGAGVRMTDAALPRPVSGRLEGSRLFSRAACIAVLALAASVLAGWWLEHAWLRSGAAGFIAMNPATAISFALASLALRLLLTEPSRPRPRLLARLCAGAVVVVALLCLARFFTPWDLGPDRLLFADQLGRVNEGRPNRMAPNTALNLVLLGVALLCLDYRTRRGWRPAEGLALTAGIFGLVAVAGYVYGSSVLYGVGTFIPMAPNTAVGFLLLSTGVLCARPAEGLAALFMGRGAGGLLARRLLPAALIIPLTLGWLRLEGQRLGLYDSAGGVALMVAASTVILAALVWRCAVELDRTEQARDGAERRLRELNEHLETRVARRTEDLECVNEELRIEVDERDRAEQALREQTAFLRQVIDTNPQLVFVKDWDGRFTLANQAVADIYGTDVAGLIGKTDAALNPSAAQVQAFLAADREVMVSGTARVIAEEAVTDGRTGQVRWFHTVKAPLAGPDGTCRKVLGVATDITARRRAEHELRRATEELRALFEASPLPICSLTPDGRVRSWNHAAEQLFGWSADEVIGRELPNIPADRMEEHGELRARVLRGQPFTNYETRRLLRDGRELDVSISTASLHDAGGVVSGVVAVYMDVSGRNALEAQLRQAQKMEAVGRLAGGVAHDFNNMLTVIRSAAEFLIADLDTADPRRKDAVEVRDTADRAGSLTRQLLAFSRQQVLQPRVVNLNTVVRELEPMVRRVVEENITVETRLAPRLDQVRADRSQLDQVILNLVVNARDAMPTGGTLLIETANVVLDGAYPRSHLSAQPGAHVALTVTDTGCGMDAATQARVFEPFFTTKGIGHGTGLGLATVYGIVKQSGGHIWVYSEIGQGTSFKIYFPRHAGAEEPQAAPAAAAEPQDRTGATIFLVEDDVAVRASVRRLLERHAYHVLEASNGEQALAALTTTDAAIDLVISDMVMPEMSGLELRQRLRATRPGLPVLLMSGYSEEAITRLGNQGAAGPLIEKPFTVQGLLDQVRRVLAAETSDA